MKITKKQLDGFYLGYMASFDGIEDTLKIALYMLMFVEKKKLLREFLEYTETLNKEGD